MSDQLSAYQDAKIDGVKILPLKKIPDERGAIIHGVRKDQLLNDFGEIYFSKIYQGAIKGWHIHETLKLNYICVFGMVKLVLYDARENSKTFNALQELFIGEDNYVLVHIPPGVANGTKAISAPYAIVCNVASEPHNPDLKYKRVNPHAKEIPYDWTRKDC